MNDAWGAPTNDREAMAITRSQSCILPLQLISGRHHARFFFAKANEHVLLVEARDDAFLGLGVAVNEIDHRASMLDCFGSIMITLQCTWAAAM